MVEPPVLVHVQGEVVCEQLERLSGLALLGLQRLRTGAEDVVGRLALPAAHASAQGAGISTGTLKRRNNIKKTNKALNA